MELNEILPSLLTNCKNSKCTYTCILFICFDATFASVWVAFGWAQDCTRTVYSVVTHTQNLLLSVSQSPSIWWIEFENLVVYVLFVTCSSQKHVFICVCGFLYRFNGYFSDSVFINFISILIFHRFEKLFTMTFFLSVVSIFFFIPQNSRFHFK